MSSTESFNNRWLTALGVPTSQPIALLANFEAELSWGRDLCGLPTSALAFANEAVRRMEQLAIWLARPGDTVLLGEPLDPSYAQHLDELGLLKGTIIAPSAWDQADDTLTRLLKDPHSAEQLEKLAVNETPIVPMGPTHELAELTTKHKLRLAAPSAATSIQVNSKVYSDQLCRKHKIRRPIARTATNLAELTSAINDLNSLDRPYCIKEALGVSGRGLYVVKNAKRGQSMLRMMSKTLTAETKCAFVLEEWIAEATDLNYQILIHQDGSYTFEGLREAVVTKGVHQGHVTPSALPQHYFAEIDQACAAIAQELHADGFYGVVGIDALWNETAGLFPCLEINARLNMSTYQNQLVERFVSGNNAAVFSKIDLPAGVAPRYPELRAALAEYNFDPETGRGALVLNFATANHRDLENSPGRLYFAIVAEDRSAALHINEEIRQRVIQKASPTS